MELSHITMLILGIVVFALGLFLIFDFVPHYDADLSDRVCYIFSITRGMIFRDKGDYIPNEFEVRTYDALAPFIPLPCKTRTLSIKRSEFDGPEEFYDEFVRLIATQSIRCWSLLYFGTNESSNNPLYPGGSGRNPFVCATIVYDFGDESPPSVDNFMEDVTTFEMSSLETDEETLGSVIPVYHMNTLFDVDCEDCFSDWTGDYKPDAYDDGRCKDHRCLFGAGLRSDYVVGSGYNLKESGVLYITYLDFPGKMISRMDMGIRACGFFDVQPKRGVRELKFTELFFDWDQAEVNIDDRLLICYEDLNI